MVALTPDQARQQLDLLLQPNADPQLTADERAHLEALATLDNPRALATALYFGWAAKAAKAAPGTDVKVGDISESGSQVYAQCRAEADRWGALAGMSGTGGRGISSRRVRW